MMQTKETGVGCSFPVVSLCQIFLSVPSSRSLGGLKNGRDLASLE